MRSAVTKRGNGSFHLIVLCWMVNGWASLAIADPSDADRYLPKLRALCGLEFKFDYDAESLKKNNKDIGWGQTKGENECHEAMRYVWYACKDKGLRKAVTKRSVRGFRCTGTDAKQGTLSLQRGLLVVERAYEEPRPYARSRKEFEKLFGISLSLSSDDPYHDEAWQKFGREPNPVLDTKTFCLVSGKKIEFDQQAHDAYVHRKEEVTVKCLKDGSVWSDLGVKDGRVTGFTTYQRDNFIRVEHFKNGVADGEEIVREDGAVKSITMRHEGTVVWTKEFFRSGKLASYSRQFPSGMASWSRDESGRLTALNCNAAAGGDDLLAEPCGFGGRAEIRLYDPRGKVRTTQTYLKGKLEKQVRGDSEHALGTDVEYANGEKQGLERVKDRDGKLVLTTNWRNGKKHGEENEFDPESQKLVTRSLWNDGTLVEEQVYYLNGELRTKETYRGERLTRFYFSDEGAPHSEERLIRCEPRRRESWCRDGETKYFSETRRLARLETWARGVLLSIKQWDEAGRLTVNRLLEKDGSVKKDLLKN